MPEIQAQMREDIAGFLPAAIKTTIISYQKFAEEEATSVARLEAKEFKLHHDACKVALAHIELLLKLASIADIPPPEMEDENQQKILLNLIENAESELNRT